MIIPLDITGGRRNKVIKTELFNYTRVEYIFSHSTGGYHSIRKLIDTPIFTNIDWSVEYNGKNREMYNTVGEFFVMICVKKVFESFTRQEMNGWINILCILMKRGFLSREIINRVQRYISQKRMPIFLRCVIRILIDKCLCFLKKEIKSAVSDNYYVGVDGIISSYVI